MRIWNVSSREEPVGASRGNERRTDRRLVTSLYFATRVVDDVASCSVHETDLRELCPDAFSQRHSCVSGMVVSIKNWLHCHEDAQVMLASVLVVLGLWWLVRTLLSVLINLVCPLLVVVLAVASCLLYVYFSAVLAGVLFKCFGTPRL